MPTSKVSKKSAKEQRQRVILLDTHAIIHRAYHALPDFTSAKGEPTGALYGLITMLLKITTELKPDYVIAAYDLPDPTHRHQVYEQYKATRKKIDDALIAQLIRSRDVLTAFNIPLYELAGFEADDMLGTIVEQLKGREDVEIVIASGDMDTLQLVDDDRVRVYTLKKGIKDTVIYDEKAVRERYGFVPEALPDYKGLAGDASDNIIGIPGIGDKSASQLVQTFGSVEGIYEALKKSDTKLSDVGVKPRTISLLKDHEDEARFSKMLATIRRDAPIDFALPDTSWRHGLDLEAIRVLLSALDFRSLRGRVEELVREGQLSIVETNEKGGSSHAGQGALDQTAVKEAFVALSLIDSNITNPSLEDIFDFTETDDFAEAQRKLMAALADRGLTRLYEDIELPLIPVLGRMETRGVLLDVDYLKTLASQYRSELAVIEARVYEVAGKTFNINSPKQLGDVLFDDLGLGSGGRLKKTPTGARSTRESELTKLRGTHPIIDAIFDYRELSKLLSTYIESLPGLIGADGRLHTTYSQIGAATGRMSSNNPNLQNIPVKTERGAAIRKAFVAAPGYTLLACDYSQIELRVAAFLSGDEKLIEIFKSGSDVHAAVASRVFGVPEAEVTKEMRRRAKVINFGILYGMGVNALRENLGTSRAEASEFYDNYFATFSSLATYLEQVKEETGQHGYTTTLFGRRRYLPGIRSPLGNIRAMAERMALNAPIQGTQADIIKLAMVRIDEVLRRELSDQAFLILQVHDELIFEVRTETIDKYAKIVLKIMEEAIPLEQTRGIPLAVHASTGPNWGALEGS
jgi:DNA polymerase-1